MDLKPGFHTIATIVPTAEKKFSNRSDQMETTLPAMAATTIAEIELLTTSTSSLGTGNGSNSVEGT